MMFAISCIAALCLQCREAKPWVNVRPEDPVMQYSGRVHMDAENNMELISSAASVSCAFTGDSLSLFLKNDATPGDYNYVTVVIDHQVQGRYPIKGNEVVALGFKLSSEDGHVLECYKATEALNGLVIFCGAAAEKITPAPLSKHPQILFIGNSITCGMGADTSGVPCGRGKWYDQHDAYFAYWPRIGRKLQADYVLHSVSGIGIYRQWDVEGPAMPDVYDHLYFDTISPESWDDHRVDPQIISIALGTNDLSPGDGVHPRKDFDSTTFITAYLDFAHRLYRHYPEARFVLLSSPMESGANAVILENCLSSIKRELDRAYPDRQPVTTFYFEGMPNPGGCGGHPDDKDHARMAEELLPVFEKLIDR